MRYYKQKKGYTCGPACMRMVLEACGVKRSEYILENLMRTNKYIGTKHKYFPKVAEKYLLDYAVIREAYLKDMSDMLENEFFVIVCYYTYFEKEKNYYYHYAVVKSINNKYVNLFDPEFGSNHKMTRREFYDAWKSHPKYEKDNKWFFAVRTGRR